NVRESVRSMLKAEPEKFSNLKDALNGLAAKLTIPLKTWIRVSRMLRRLLYQRRLHEVWQ
ncbi:TPA: hypothetical protein EYP27_01125, partial [Candidatus Bathyarchaeota archaeon]|nr:hypothetical protein [Candidatus Bathyarchaeota archaeon]